MKDSFYIDFTSGIYIAMAIWGVFSVYYTFKIYLRGPNSVNLYLYDGLGSAFTTLGLLGTFVGIYLGLRSFNVHNISESIPDLLDGLKSAFTTSIVGITLSIIVSKCTHVSLHYSEKKWRLSVENDQNDLLEILVTEFRELNANLIKQTHLFNEKYNSLVNVISCEIEENNKLLHGELSNISNYTGSIQEKLTTIVDKQDKYTKIMKNGLTAIYDCQKELISIYQENNVTSLQGFDKVILQFEKSRIFFQEKMDTFTELLAKNNTESLVEVMKRTTESFNSQMSALIERLVQENFKELNISVQNLNDWQQENKVMIASLTQQFTQVSQDLITTERAITSIANHTNELTNSNSELVKLINLLKTVMIDDNKFRDITYQLTSAVKTLENNTQAFDKTTHKLNDWVRKQMTFSDSVEILLTRLEQIDRIKDINDIFWNETKDKLNEGISIITTASQQLEKELDNLNGEFYERLNNTFTNLDMLIQRIIEKYRE